jgi:hypothetical protein
MRWLEILNLQFELFLQDSFVRSGSYEAKERG